MEIILQDLQTAKFIRCDSSWTSDRNEALDFFTVKRAVSFGMKELKDSFQVIRIEPGDLKGTVILAISNLQWPEAAQPVLSISLANGLPKPAVELGNRRQEQNSKQGKHPANRSPVHRQRNTNTREPVPTGTPAPTQPALIL
jgi:hypothetical protein